MIFAIYDVKGSVSINDDVQNNTLTLDKSSGVLIMMIVGIQI
mgnify:FL=1